MPKKYHLSLTIEDELVAEDIDEAWATFSSRIEDRFYGPTQANIEDLGEVPEEITE